MLDVLRRRSEGTEIRAPIPGWVLTHRPDEKVGQELRAGEALAVIGPTEVLELRGRVADDEIARIHREDAVRFRVSALPDRTFVTRVREIAPHADSAAGNSGASLVARASLRIDGERLRPGMEAEAKVVGRDLPPVVHNHLGSHSQGGSTGGAGAPGRRGEPAQHPHGYARHLHEGSPPVRSVVGRRFCSSVLAEELAARPADEDLGRLREGAFVRSLGHSRVPGDREYVFDHLLLQEVAYNSLLRELRADLHGSAAGWLEVQPAGAVPEYHDLVAHHWEKSDEPHRAIPHLERAARDARERGALEDARSAVQRALDLVDGAGDRAQLLELDEDLVTDVADDERREELIDALEGLAEREGRAELSAEAACRRARLEPATGRPASSSS